MRAISASSFRRGVGHHARQVARRPCFERRRDFDAREFLFEFAQEIKLAHSVVSKLALLLSGFDRPLPFGLPRLSPLDCLLRAKKKQCQGKKGKPALVASHERSPGLQPSAKIPALLCAFRA